jgi:sulfur carrier protein ThiS adenylyltransferase
VVEMTHFDCTFTKENYDTVLCDRHTAQVQELLSKAHVTICGLGGLGSNIAVMLARAGIGHLHLIDFDEVELSNINRQAYFSHQVGMKKTAAILQILQMINPYLDIQSDNVYITEENAKSLLASSDIICEAFDVPENKAMLTNFVLEHFPDIPYVAASGMAGYSDSNAIKTRRITDSFYLCGDLTNGASKGHGLMAPRVTICASHQANMIIRLLLQSITPLSVNQK